MNDKRAQKRGKTTTRAQSSQEPLARTSICSILAVVWRFVCQLCVLFPCVHQWRLATSWKQTGTTYIFLYLSHLNLFWRRLQVTNDNSNKSCFRFLTRGILLLIFYLNFIHKTFFLVKGTYADYTWVVGRLDERILKVIDETTNRPASKSYITLLPKICFKITRYENWSLRVWK